MPLRIAVVVMLVVGLLGFFVTRGLISQAQQHRQSQPVVTLDSKELEPAISRSPSASGEELSVYDGKTRELLVTNITTTCGGVDARKLIDARDSTGWECEGAGVGERIEFQFSGVQPVVGLRLVSGNAGEPQETVDQRQVVSVRWRFSDGSWFEQGLSGRNGSAQEVVFPEILADSATLEIVATTDPASAEDGDAVTIGDVEFLRPL